MDVNENTLLGNRYRVTHLLGRGGMGAVFLANDIRFHDGLVAVKQTLVARDCEDLRKAFQREAQLLYHLRHPALPRVTDFFGQEDAEFLVMEFVPGEDLATLVTRRGGPFPVERVAVWADKLLDVLSYLHTRRPPVIHRDIKPQNMKLTPDGEIVLLDFGLAKGAVGLTTGTVSSVVAGTRYFAPPEQLSGQGTDERSDLYSLAATLYALLSATLPTDASVRSSCHINGQDDPLRAIHELVPSVPESVSAVIMQAMRLRKNERPATAIIMRNALRDALAATLPAVTSCLASVTIQGVDEAPPSDAGEVRPVGDAQAGRPTSSGLDGSERGAAVASDAPSSTSSARSEAAAGDVPATHSKSTFGVALSLAALALGVVALTPLLLRTRAPESVHPVATTNAMDLSAVAEPARTSPATRALTSVLRYRIEYEDGRSVDGALPAKTRIRLRTALDVPASVYVLAINPDGTASVVLSDRNARQWNLTTVRGGPGSEIVLPGRGKQLIVETGKERFIVVAIRPGATPPRALAVEPFTPITTVQAGEVSSLVARTLRDAEIRREGEWWTVRHADIDGGGEGLVAVEIPQP